MARTASLVKLVTPGALLAFLVVLLAACGAEATTTPQPTPVPTAIPAIAPTLSPIATATPIPEPTVIPTAIPTAEPTPPPTTIPTVAIKAEVSATLRQFGQALGTADAELLASLFLQSEKTNSFSSYEPLRINGWPAVEGSFKGLLSLPPGSVSLVPRQGRIDLLGHDAALWTGHFILNVRPPEESPQSVNGRFTSVLQKADGKWLIVHMHTSALPE